METRASHLVVGAFVLVLLTALFGFAAWLAKVSFEEGTDLYRIHFTGSVTGLQTGSAVSYQGLPVGRVTDIRIDPDDVERVRVTVEVQEGTPIKADTIASLELQGITGTSFVQLGGGTQQAPLLRAEAGEEVPVIRSRPSALAEVFDAAPLVLGNLIELSDRLTAFLSPENEAAFAATLANVSHVTASLDEATAELPETAAEARRTLALVGSLVAELDGTVARLGGRAESVLTAFEGTAGTAEEELTLTAARLRETAESLRTAADQTAALVRENREPIRDFTANSLFDINLLITEVRDLTANVGRLATRIERDPASFLLGGTRRGVQLE